MVLTKPDCKALTEYELKLDVARKQFTNRTTALLSPDIEPTVLELFLINYSALGVSMTEPVEDWINRAGEKCKEIGLADLGRALCAHAQHEAGHHHMMIEDTQTLVSRWNSQHQTNLAADEILGQPITESVQKYIQLHEDVIASDAPYGQLAIELEIESLSVTFLPSLIDNCKGILGNSIIEGMSFLEEHVALDVSHTHFNQKQLKSFLNEHPDCVASLVSSGERGLNAYANFLLDCLKLAETQAKELT